MQFNPDPNKQVQEVYFSKKTNNVSSHHVSFNNTKIVTFSSQKNLGLVLDQQLNLTDHIQSKMTKCYVLRDLVLFAKFKKREKHPWKSVNFTLQLY